MNIDQINLFKESKLKKTYLALLGIFFIITLAISSANVTAQETYEITINAYCLNEGVDVIVDVTYDGSSYPTPHIFIELIGENTFVVPSEDPSGHPFAYWQDDESLTNPERIITAGGEYVAVYFDPTIIAEVNIDPDTFNLKSKRKIRHSLH